MTFRNKKTDEIVEANSFIELFAFTNNSNYEEIEIKTVDDKDINKFNKTELIKYLTDLEIEFDKKMSKDKLLELALNYDSSIVSNETDEETIVSNLEDENIDDEEIIVEDIIDDEESESEE